MNGPAAIANELARRVLECEAGQSSPPQANPGPVSMDRLRKYMVMFVGSAGFGALLGRALALARAQVYWLETVEATDDGALLGYGEALLAQTQHQAQKGENAILTHLFSLLVALVGEAITLNMVRDVWPDVSTDGLITSAKEPTR